MIGLGLSLAIVPDPRYAGDLFSASRALSNVVGVIAVESG